MCEGYWGRQQLRESWTSLDTYHTPHDTLPEPGLLMLSVLYAAARLGVCTKTIKRWDSSGLLRCLRTPGGHRRVPISEIERILSGTARHPVVHETGPGRMAVYARVS